MKFPVTVAFVFLIIAMFIQCNSNMTESNDCDFMEDMINFNEESFEAFVPDFFNKKELIFIDSLDRERRFIGEFKHEILSSPNSIYCYKNDQWTSLYRYEKYIGRFVDNDSLKILIVFNIIGDDCFYPFSQEGITNDRLSVSCYYSASTQNPQFVLGHFSKIVSNYIDDHPTSNCYEEYSEEDQIILGGNIFIHLLSSPDNDIANHDIYFKYGTGIVGIIDTFGVSWRIK